MPDWCEFSSNASARTIECNRTVNNTGMQVMGASLMSLFSAPIGALVTFSNCCNSSGKTDQSAASGVGSLGDVCRLFFERVDGGGTRAGHAWHDLPSRQATHPIYVDQGSARTHEIYNPLQPPTPPNRRLKRGVVALVACAAGGDPNNSRMPAHCKCGVGLAPRRNESRRLDAVWAIGTSWGERDAVIGFLIKLHLLNETNLGWVFCLARKSWEGGEEMHPAPRGVCID